MLDKNLNNAIQQSAPSVAENKGIVTKANSFDKKSRRSDDVSRQAIFEIEELLYDPSGAENTLKISIEALKKVSNSQYAVAFSACDNQTASLNATKEHEMFLPLEKGCSLRSYYCKESPPFVNINVLRSWLADSNLLTTTVFYNKPIPQSTQTLLNNKHPISSLMIIPVMIEKVPYGSLILANATKAYSGALLTKLVPIIGALICTLRSVRQVNSSFNVADYTKNENTFINALIASSPNAIVLVNDDAKIVGQNKLASEIFYPSRVQTHKDSKYAQMKGINIHHFFPDYESLFLWTHQYDKYGVNNRSDLPKTWQERTACRHDGSSFQINLSAFRHHTPKGRITVLQIQDIAHYKDQAFEHQRLTQELNVLTKLAPVGIIRVTPEWDCTFTNAMWSEFTGYDADQGEPKQWINGVHPGDVKQLLEGLRNSLLCASELKQEVRLINASGATRWVDFSSRVLLDEVGEVNGFLATCHDITERFISQEKLRQTAQFDGLTGLANRMLFNDRMQQAFYRSERDKSVITIVFLDLDGFKDINDSLGHDAGDLLLQKLAERLNNTLRKNDTVARFGGDEFVVMLGSNSKTEEAQEIACKLINAIAQPFDINGNKIFVTASMGLASGDFTSSSPKLLLKHADIALYAAKRKGKNCFELFDSELDQEAQQRIELTAELRYGLESNQFTLYYQALTDSKSLHIVGFEALLRFNSMNNGLVSPSEFIPLLEDNNMIVDVGKWVISQTCKQLSLWRHDPTFSRSAYVSFNVSSKQLLDPSFVDHIRACCVAYQVNPSNLVMEITETVLIVNPKIVKNVFISLKQMGVRIALDDFGTGYSSLSYLKDYPIDIIKIDKAFISQFSEEKSNIAIVKAITAMASSLDMLVIAEGIETKATVLQLSSFDIDIYQGFYFAKPLSHDNALRLCYNNKRSLN